jgi:hypothetical protein
MNNPTSAVDKRFHGYLDTELVYWPGRVVETKETKHLIIQEREVGYRFYPHFHPYIGQLVQRLLRKFTSGLQAADTEYQKNDDGTLAAFGTLATLPDGTRVTIPDGTLVTPPDGTLATFPDGTQVTLQDGAPLALLGGKLFVLVVGAQVVIPDSTLLTLTNTTQITRPDGTPATFPDGTSVALLGGKPRPVLYEDFFPARYNPSDLVQQPHPVKDLDFTSGGAYSIYNWELFFHVPITIAIHLSKNQRFAEAQRWFHFLFDPTDDSEGSTPERFWKVRPFQTTDVKEVEGVLVNLATNADPTLRDETVRSIEAWKAAPFRPHVIARYRQQAYMYKTVMAYLDNLISWGDSLFRQDTGEAIDEATMLYVLAANILGPRPQPVPKKGTVRPQTYANLRADLKQFGVVMREVETAVPFDLMPFPTEDGGDNERLTTLRSLGQALYFCVPRNDKLLSYWDTVADRLFKIRNSLNIQGIFRQLPLFEPPIDPALLARAATAGLDVGAVVNGLNQPLPLVRFQLLVQKAAEMCQEVKSLGNNLLSAMEKEDGEAMALLRAKHERIVMEMVEHVRYAQVQEAIKSREGLLKSLALAVQRYTYYERQLGKKPDEIAIPELDELGKDRLNKMRFATQEPEVAPREIEMDIEQDLGDSGGKIVSSYEAEEMKKSGRARDLQDTVRVLQLLAQGFTMVPDPKLDAHYWGIGGTINLAGGEKLAAVAKFAADVALAYADRLDYEASRAAKVGSYARREQDWAFQSNLAAGEVTQIFKQLRAAQIREAIAELELNNHRQQMKHAEEIERFLNEEGAESNGKKTNKALYAWMKREVKGLYGQCFQFAFDIAKKAERALKHELGNPELSYLQFGYLAGKEGLLAGEKLYVDIKRMEMAYHDLNQREYELTKHVSLMQVDPLALLQLRTTGRCTVSLPEALFDMDGPGHYFRRIKSLAVSIPCVTGPYASINCTLTLLKSSIRKTQVLDDGYAREDAEDNRFDDYFGSLQSIVTSSGQNDSGMFETNLRDERYLPFEGSGVISEWQLELPADVRQFDYDTISDVILHLRYTARQGGGLLRNGAVANLEDRIKEAQAVGSVRLFSVRHEFPSEWAKFKSVRIGGTTTTGELSLDIREEHFPYWSKGRLKAIKRMDIFAKKADGAGIETVEPNGSVVEITTHQPDGQESKETLTDPTNIVLPQPPNKFSVKFTHSFDDNAMEDLWLALAWGNGE